MNFKTTYWLFALLLALVAAFVIRALFVGGKKGDVAAVFPTIADEKITAADITQLDIRRPGAPGEGQTMTFVRQGPGNSWKMTAPAPMRVDGSAVENVVTDVVALRREEKADVPKDPGAVGLDKPSLYVTLKKGDREWTLEVGNVSFGQNAKVFVRSSDRGNDILAVRETSLSSLFRTENISEGGPAGSLVKTVADFRSKGLLGDFGPADTVQHITLQAAGGQPVVLGKGSDNRWRFEQPAGYGDAEQEGESPTPPFTPPGAPAPEPKPPTGVGALLRELLGLRVTSEADFEPEDANKDLNAAYGLDANNPATFKVTLARAGGVSQTLLVGKKAEKKPGETEDKYYVRLADEKTVEKIPAKELEPVRKLLEKPDVLRNHDLLTANAQTIDAFNLQLSGQPPLEFRKTEGAWKLYDDKGNAAAVDESAVKQMLDALTQPRQVKDFPKPGQTDNQLGFDNPAMRVALWVDGVAPPEKKPEPPPAPPPAPPKPPTTGPATTRPGQPTPAPAPAPATPPAPPPPAKPKLKKEKPDYELLFGHTEREMVNVRRLKDGQPAGDFLVPEALLKTVKKDRTTAASLRLDFLDKNLPTFPADQVTKLEINKTGGETLTLDKEQKEGQPATWKATHGPNAPPRTGDAVKINAVLAALANPAFHGPVLLAAEHADANDLALWKLNPARLVVTVHLKDDKDHPKGRTYRFGDDSSDKTHVYLKLDDREQVYQVPRAVFDQLNQDLIDPTVFRLELAKVKKVKIVGKLPAVIGNPGPDGKVTLELERKGLNQWEPKAGVNYPVDGPKVEEFLGHLREVRAAGMVAKGTVKPEQTQFDPAAGGLEIVIEQEGEKDPFTLTLGGLDATGLNYYAQSNRVPGEVFLLPKAAFAPVKDKVYFGK